MNLSGIMKAGVIMLIASSITIAGCAGKKKVVEEPVDIVEAAPIEEQELPPQEELYVADVETTDTDMLLPTEEELLEEEALEGVDELEPVAEVEELQPPDIFFDFDKSELDDSSREALNAIAGWLESALDVKLRIEGHADERGSSEYNIALGERRADAAKRYLVTLGIDQVRLSTISYGEEMPVDTGHTEEAWAKNRRVHFEVIKE